MNETAIFWFRRDLRLKDNTGLSAALKAGLPVQPLFIFDTDILSKLEDRADRRVQFIHQELLRLDRELKELGSGLRVEHGKPLEIWKRIFSEGQAKHIYFNRDYEPYAVTRDAGVAKLAEKNGVGVHDFKDHVIFEKMDVEKKAGGPYTVFTPYSRTWKERLTDEDLKSHSLPKGAFAKTAKFQIPSLAELGFTDAEFNFPPAQVEKRLIDHYQETRNTPSILGTSRLGVHLRFGTVSVRELVKKARASSNETWLGELIWREFFTQILWHFPHVVEGPFRPEYAKIQWRDNDDDFQAWCRGETGYPLVDAGMRELNETGFMHNRVRMVTASFLVKHLLIDWRRGEKYFAQKLLDFELASNNGNWQWVAGTGCDAAPYFRVFNPETQMKKFDRDKVYVKTWVPEFGTEQYAGEIVDHRNARVRTLRAYAIGLGKKAPEPTR